MSMYCIEELTTENEFREAYPVMEQLRPVGEETFLEVVSQMRKENDYQLFARRNADSNKIYGLAGVVINTNLYHGKHTWVHDLVVNESYRGMGHGGELLSWITSWADDRDCSCIELASGLWRDETHEFYEKEGLEKYCYTFKKDLTAKSLY